MKIDWSKYPDFKLHEFACKHTGECRMHPMALALFQRMRTRLNRALILKSGYRDPTHPDEVKKEKPGSHAQGKAADFAVTSAKDAYEIMEAAMAEATPGTRLGIGIAKTFIHIDIGHDYMPRPATWSY